ncbi:hypothetical protein AAKU55_001302 [Oxalobacteraceae bacterium GrIS 1.11]
MFKKITLIATIGAALSACYVVPINQGVPSQSAPAAAVAVYPAAPIQTPPLTARLYPTNDAAARIGRVSGTISRPEKGYGLFTVTAGNETYSGEATREQGSAKGTANAAGNRGGYIKCDYTMSNSSLGTGVCEFSNGSRFDMHISD